MAGNAGKGRKKGVPNKATVEIREAARAIVEDPSGRRRMIEQYRAGRLHPAVTQMLFHYAYGKPKDVIEHQGIVQSDNVTGLSLAEMAARAERLRRLLSDGDSE